MNNDRAILLSCNGKAFKIYIVLEFIGILSIRDLISCYSFLGRFYIYGSYRWIILKHLSINKSSNSGILSTMLLGTS
jgi:hypothetical protein